jgi:hypothetical protein
MSTHTAQQKIELVEAFTAAKKYLWNGKVGKKGQGGLESAYICQALQLAVQNGDLEYFKADIAQDLIEHRLGRHCSVNDYLYENGYTQTLHSTLASQAYRLAWLDSLIAEFSA